MKKLFVLLTLICVFLWGVEVDAACASGASVNGEFVCLVSGATEGNSNGTAYPENGVLVLKNYNSGSISYSSGLGNPLSPVTIRLVGDNYITADNSFGVRVPLSGVEFVGDGTLTIKSKLPIAVVDMENTSANVTLASNTSTIKILAGSKVNEDKNVTNTVEIDEEEQNNTTTETGTEAATETAEVDWSLILVVVCCAISVICLLLVVGNIISNKKGKK